MAVALLRVRSVRHRRRRPLRGVLRGDAFKHTVAVWVRMADKGLEKAADRIWRSLEPIAVASFGGGTGILVVDGSGIRSRAQRAEAVREAAGRHGALLDVVVLSPEANYDEIFDDPAWASVAAVQTGAVYEAPCGPYNWMDRPPSVQRVLAVKWLGNLLYPELFDYDMITETQEFYRLFFHYELTED